MGREGLEREVVGAEWDTGLWDSVLGSGAAAKDSWEESDS